MRRLAGSLCVLLVVLSTAWAGSVAAVRDGDRAVDEVVRAVRAGLRCTAERGAALPEALDPAALPGICGLLAEPRRLQSVAADGRVGYRRLSETRYRLCAAFGTPPGLLPPLPGLGPEVRCVEETLAPGEAAPAPRRRRGLA